jgi:Rieske Fe-S protein
MSHLLTRRSLGGLAAAGAGVPLLAACGSDDAPAAADAPSASPSVTLGPTSGVPVGGGTVYADPPVVVTQPEAGTFKAFSSFCTHRGCPVSEVSEGLIQCHCHGSQYSIADGSVVRGPAPDPLVPLDCTVRDGQVTTSG